MTDRLARISPYTVGVALLPIVALPVLGMIRLAWVGITEDRVLAVIGTCVLLGTGLMTLLTKLAKAMPTLVPLLRGILKGLRELRGDVDGVKLDAISARAKAEAAEAGHEANSQAIVENRRALESLQSTIAEKDNLIRTLIEDTIRGRVFDPPTDPPPPAPDATRAVLIVDDDPYTSKAISRILRNRGYKTAVAADAAEAIRLLEHLPPVVLLDLKLHGDLGGEDVLRHIRDNHLPIRVIVASGVVDDPGRLAAVSELRPDAILAKPIDAEAMLALVRGDRAEIAAAVILSPHLVPAPIPKGFIP